MKVTHGRKSHAGVTLVEAMVAIVVLAVAVIGTAAFLFHAHSALGRASVRTAAVEVCASRLEEVSSAAYADIAAHVETDTPVFLHETEAMRSTEVLDIDEDVDGEVDYRRITVTVVWTQANGLEQEAEAMTLRSQ